MESRPADFYEPLSEYVEEPFGVGDVVPYLVVLACVAAVVLLFLPVSLSHVDGYPSKPGASATSRNLLREGQDKLLEGTGILVFTEEDVNRYLQQRLKGAVGMLSSVEGIYADLQDRAVTIYLVQRFLGLPFVASTTWDYYIENQRTVRRCSGSSVGRLRFNGILVGPLMTPFSEFARACKPEAGFLDLEGIENVVLEPGFLKLEIQKKS